VNSNEKAGRLVHLFHVIMDSIADLPQDDVERVEELVQVGEWALALENLCSQPYEYDVDLWAETLGLIKELGRDVGVADRYWTVLMPAEPESPEVR
jgi:hypothetical protein